MKKLVTTQFYARAVIALLALSFYVGPGFLFGPIAFANAAEDDRASISVPFVACDASDSACGDNVLARLFGEWDGADTAAVSIFGKITISRREITWGGKGISPCRSKYTIVGRYFGTTYPDQEKSLQLLNSGRVYTTFRLKITDRRCALTAKFIQVSALSDVEGLLEVVTYDEIPNGPAIGHIRFTRRD